MHVRVPPRIPLFPSPTASSSLSTAGFIHLSWDNLVQTLSSLLPAYTLLLPLLLAPNSRAHRSPSACTLPPTAVEPLLANPSPNSSFLGQLLSHRSQLKWYHVRWNLSKGTLFCPSHQALLTLPVFIFFMGHFVP